MDNSMNVCFISYRHSNSKHAQEIIKSFCDTLKGQISLFIPDAKVYLDTDLRVADLFDSELATQLCRSSCMIMLYNPYYFDPDHPYCTREYMAMVEIERQRLGQAHSELKRKGLIIPVIIRGADSLPDEIKKRHYITFDKQLLLPADFDDRELVEKVYEIAQVVYERHTVFKDQEADLIATCDETQFPSEDESRDWIERVVAAKPKQHIPGS